MSVQEEILLSRVDELIDEWIERLDLEVMRGLGIDTPELLEEVFEVLEDRLNEVD